MDPAELFELFAGLAKYARTLPSVFPDLPTVAEAGVPGFSAASWYGLFAPAKAPGDVIDRLNKTAAAAVQSEAFRRLGVNEGLVMVASPLQELDRYFRGEEERWRKVIQDAGITPNRGPAGIIANGGGCSHYRQTRQRKQTSTGRI